MSFPIVTTKVPKGVEAKTIKKTLISRCAALKPLGGGAFGNAYEHPTNPNLVIKVAIGGWNEEDAYLKWIMLGRQYPSKHVQRVVHLQVFTPESGGRVSYVVVLERLASAQRLGLDDKNRCAKTLDGRLKDVKNITPITARRWAANAKDLHIRNLGKCLVGVWGQDGANADLHDGNWMLRRNGDGTDTVVITDPAV